MLDQDIKQNFMRKEEQTIGQVGEAMKLEAEKYSATVIPCSKVLWLELAELLIEKEKQFDELANECHGIAEKFKSRSQWINIKDKLPSRKGKYLCLWNYHSEDVEPSADVLYFDGTKFPWEQARKDVRVSHWRQLPELP